MKKIKYVGFYDTAINEYQKRNYILAATNKMDYIAAVINKCGYKVEFISPSWTYNKKFYKSKKIKLDKDISLKIGPSIPWIKFFKLLSVVLSNVWLFFYLLIFTNKNENIIAYHSNWIILPVYLAKKIKKFNLILEIEEVYSHVKNSSNFILKMEEKFFSVADQYIFSTELLETHINKDEKPFSVIYGTYQTEYIRDNNFNDNKIHIVYAGTLDPRKGSITAVQSAVYLGSQYHLHIIGAGTLKDVEKLKMNIKEVSMKTECKITYDGVLRGEDYIQFIQSCKIGLSPQSPDSAFNETSFPSKILSYLANGLKVVSIKIKSIEKSKISSLIKFYQQDEPKNLAEAIKNVDFQISYDSRQEIEKLSIEFQTKIASMIIKGSN